MCEKDAEVGTRGFFSPQTDDRDGSSLGTHVLFIQITWHRKYRHTHDTLSQTSHSAPRGQVTPSSGMWSQNVSSYSLHEEENLHKTKQRRSFCSVPGEVENCKNTLQFQRQHFQQSLLPLLLPLLIFLLRQHRTSVGWERRFDLLPAVRWPDDVRGSTMKQPYRHLGREKNTEKCLKWPLGDLIIQLSCNYYFASKHCGLKVEVKNIFFQKWWTGG